MIRFFARQGTLTLESSFCPPVQAQTMRGNILEVIGTLRACPAYQIDSNHAHCGIRSKLLFGLQHIMPLSQAGICLNCWRVNMEAESWERSPAKGKWTLAPRSPTLQFAGILKGCEAHQKCKALYTAEERDWTFHVV